MPPLHRIVTAFACLSLSLGAAVAGCSGTKEVPPPLVTQLPLTLAASPSQILPDGSQSTLTLTALNLPAVTPGIGTVHLTAEHGTFDGKPSPIDLALVGGSTKTSYACDATIDAKCIGNQVLNATWNGNTVAGSVLVTRNPVVVTDAGGGTDATPEAGRDPATISHVATTCAGVRCGILGVKGSGFQEQADVAFVVKDTNGSPVGGVPVTFTLDQPPLETTVSPSGISDATGIATAKVQAGKVLGVFTVRATVKAGQIETVSPAIGIRGVKPANRGFSLQCDPKNLGAYASAAPPLALSSTCSVKLVDRFNNPVGKATTVNFKSEAGTIPSSVTTVAFDPTSAANDKEGTASVVFNTPGTFPPRDVAPLNGEPSGTAGNRRDGLVTVLAYVSGEEYFEDSNSDGVRNAGESFIDQGEPFIDENDNNQWDPGEFYADVAPSNGKYDEANGTWESNTSIWAVAYILYTDFPNAYFLDPGQNQAPIPMVPSPLPSVPRDNTISFKMFGVDPRYNIMPASATYAASLVSGRGSIFNAGVPLVGNDGYGFAISRKTVDASDGVTPCTPQMPRCLWTTSFSNLGATNPGMYIIKGGAAADPPGQVNGTFVLTTTFAGLSPGYQVPLIFQ